MWDHIDGWPGGYRLAMKSTPRVPDDRPLMVIGYKYNSRKVLEFLATEGAGSNDRIVSILLFVHPHMLCRHFNAFNKIDNNNRMRQSDPELEKYWVTQSGHFRLTNILALVFRNNG